ncbi:GPO family capsid scaffolding protein [Vibrio diabolicus]|uniref:GPO family capsid scaffolding protein n=1 Tax=Vibrio diabolicus TaxID=50719 RepID=UPI0015F369DE|nr:GPO family capsid scaffolding protein [Vibrio diabolicus]
MFKSEPICVLTAGPTIDGRDIPQQVIDDIAETYDPKKYTARINDNHSEWSWKGGSVLSAEARGSELWVEIKPNSHLLRNIENGQLLHTSCEYLEDFAKTGKSYLTGLAFTDEPASLGTTQVHLSTKAKEDGKKLVSSGQMLNLESLSTDPEQEREQSWLVRQLHSLLNRNSADEQLSQQEDETEMSKETEELLKQSIEQNKELNSQLGQLVTCLSAQSPQENEEEGSDNTDDNGEVTELKGQVETLSTQVGELKDELTKLSKLTDEGERKPAGSDGEEEQYL